MRKKILLAISLILTMVVSLSLSLFIAVANAAPAEISDEEKANIADLMAKLGL